MDYTAKPISEINTYRTEWWKSVYSFLPSFGGGKWCMLWVLHFLLQREILLFAVEQKPHCGFTS